MANPVTSKASLCGEDLVKHYDGVQALQGVSLELVPGQILGLIGPNGSGKTTLLNCLSGSIRPTSGRLKFNGSDCTGKPSHRVARLGVGRTFQNIRLFPSMSPRENVEIALSVGRAKGDGSRTVRALEVMDEMGLNDVADREVSGLPYGLQRRLEIARAVAPKPQYLLLDEPAAGMNEEETDDLLDLLRVGVQRWRCGILIVDHDLRLIMRLCSRLQVLNEGRTIAVGSPKEIQRNPEVIAAYLGTTVGSQ